MLAAFATLTASCGDDDETEAGGGVRRRPPAAIVAPSASNDLAFSQSMVDGVANMSTVDVDITDGTFIVEDAAAAIRGYAEDGFDLVIATARSTAVHSRRSPPTIRT